MRAYGVDEKFITGDGDDKEKFFRFAEALPHFIGNPVYHWAHLELKSILTSLSLFALKTQRRFGLAPLKRWLTAVFLQRN